MNENKYKYDVFISYARRDGRIDDRIIVFTEMLKAEVTRRGKHDFSVFIDMSEIPFGEPFALVIRQAIIGSQIFIAMVTESYLRSEMCQWECSTFYNLLDKDTHRKLIPVLWNNNGIQTRAHTEIYKRLFALNMPRFTESPPIRKEINKQPTPQVVKDAIGTLATRIIEILGWPA